MTTEQMDDKDATPDGRSRWPFPTTDDRRKAAAAALPEILYGTPTDEELAAARGRAGSRGVLVIPEEMRGLIGESFFQPAVLHETPPPLGPYSEARESRPIDWADGYQEDDAKVAADELAMALFHTVEYVGTETLPPVRGWAWYEALLKHRPDLLPEMHTDAEWAEIRDEKNRDSEAPETATMAEEPIEDRLRRAWANGWQEGFNRGSRGDDRWDRW